MLFKKPIPQSNTCPFCNGTFTPGQTFALSDERMCRNCFENLDSLNRNLIFDGKFKSKMTVNEVKG